MGKVSAVTVKVSSELKEKMKTFCACGGTAKNGQIILQGDHREKVQTYLIQQLGYPQENIEVQ